MSTSSALSRPHQTRPAPSASSTTPFSSACVPAYIPPMCVARRAARRARREHQIDLFMLLRIQASLRFSRPCGGGFASRDALPNINRRTARHGVRRRLDSRPRGPCQGEEGADQGWAEYLNLQRKIRQPRASCLMHEYKMIELKPHILAASHPCSKIRTTRWRRCGSSAR